MDTIIHLDYSLETTEERKALVDKIIAEADPQRLTPKYLEILADYILVNPETKGDKEILTTNRLKTIKRRETSYQTLASKFENGEDGLYNLFIKDKGARLTQKIEITEEDIKNVKGLAELRKDIEDLEKRQENATGKQRYHLKKQIIELRKLQYDLKNSHYQPVQLRPTHGTTVIDYNENITMDEYGEPHSDGLISLFEPDHVSAILCNYKKLKSENEGRFNNGIFYLLEDLDTLIEKNLKVEFPIHYEILKSKTNGKTNIEIQNLLQEKYGTYHSIEYISVLWRNKIPKYLSEKAKENYILWYYTEVERGVWKKCNRCGEIKLAHNRFFSRNGTSKDGWYSLCKECRNNAHKKIAVGQK